MRQWLTDVTKMCRPHLMGEHAEMHMFCGSIKKRISMKGYFRNNLLQLDLLKTRHDEIANELIRRGYNHVTPLELPNLDHFTEEEKEWKIDKENSKETLLSRCCECRRLHEL